MEDDIPNQEPPAPAASGVLQRTPFAHLLVYASERRLTGTLEFAHPDGRTATLGVVGGHVNKVRTSEAIVHLGRVLLELGFLTQNTLDKSLLALAKGGVLHGELLMRDGAITHEQLVRGLEEQLARKLAHLFTYPVETTFSFFDHYDALRAYGGSEALSIDLFPIVWRGICLAPPWDHVDAALSRVAHARLRAKPDASFERFHFEADVAGVASILREHNVLVSHFTAGEVISASAAQLLLYCLIITRQIDVVETPPNPVSSSLPPSPSAPPQGSSRPAPRPIRVERPSHPKIMIGGTPGPASGQFAVTRLVTEIPQPSRQGDSSVPKIAVSDHAARRQEITTTLASIEQLNYFEVLGVSESATQADVEAAFVNLAKRWHPDRLPAAIADMHEACTRVFSRLSEAHKALIDPEGRRRYIELLKEGGATPEAQAYIARVVAAASSFQKAEVCLKRGDYAQAETLCRAAHDADASQADYVALLAWLESLRPANQSTPASYERIAMLDRAIVMNPRCERAYYYRGLLHKKVGSIPLALEDFRHAAELNPNNVDATREIRLYVTRRTSSASMPAAKPKASSNAPTPSPASKISGIFGKLLKKD